jgi:hypothetical protein
MLMDTNASNTDGDIYGTVIDHQAALQRAVTLLQRWLVTLTVAGLLLAAGAAAYAFRELTGE